MICPKCGATNSEYNPSCYQCDGPLTLTEQAATPRDFEPGTRMAHFEILAKVGQGGMGTVYKAQDRDLERPVALKMIHDTAGDDEQQLLAEAKMASSLNHPNIVTMFGVFREPQGKFIAMEWVDGQTLKTLIPEQGFPLREVLDYGLGIAKGLARAHENKMIHRDIKPGNIMITSDGTVKVLDFGLAQPSNLQTRQEGPLSVGNNSVTQTGFIKGTPAYMSPEQSRGETLGVTSDVFSFGILLYQMCSGQHPFSNQGKGKLLEQIQSAPIPALTEIRLDLPGELVDLVADCLRKDPRKRPANMGQVLKRLRAMREDLSGSQPLPAVKPKPKWKSWLLAPLLVAVLALGYLGLKPVPPEQEVPIPLQSLAVMPLENLTGDPALDVFCEGLAATVNINLLQTSHEHPQVWVVPPGEMRRLKRKDSTEAYRRFGVRHALTGSVQYGPDGFRFHLTVVKTDTLESVATQILTSDVDQLFESQNQLVEAAFQLLKWELPAPLPELKASETDTHQRYLMAISYSYRGDRRANLERAESELLAILDKEPDHVSALVALTENYRLMWVLDKIPDAVDNGLKTIERALALRDDLASAHIAKGNLLIEKGLYGDAERAFEVALELQPDQHTALYGLGRALARAERFEEAEQRFQQATRLNPHNWLGQTEFGRLYYTLGNMEGAEQVFRNLANLAPENPSAQSNLAIILYTLGRLQEALSRVDQALALEKDDMLLATKGNIHFFQGDFEMARAAFEQALAINPDLYSHHGNLADTLRQLGEAEASVAAYERAIELTKAGLEVNPKDTDFQIMLVHYLARSGREGEAAEQLQSLPEPSGAVLSYWHAVAYELLGDRQRALHFLEQAISLNYSLTDIQYEPDLAELRQDPRFAGLMKANTH